MSGQVSGVELANKTADDLGIPRCLMGNTGEVMEKEIKHLGEVDKDSPWYVHEWSVFECDGGWLWDYQFTDVDTRQVTRHVSYEYESAVGALRDALAYAEALEKEVT